MNKLVMFYDRPAENSDIGWERQSLPLGNGYMGANIFGGIDIERIQMTSNELANPLSEGGLNNFAEIYIDFFHSNVKKYVRGLDLNNAYAFCDYEYNGFGYTRQAFTSYPDNCLVIKLTCDRRELSFDIRPIIPYIESSRKTGEVKAMENVLILRGTLPLHNLIFEAQMTVDTDGEVAYSDNKVSVKNAGYAYIYYVQGTSYKLDSKVFLEQETTKKTVGDDPHNKVTLLLENALKCGYDNLYLRHVEDYSRLFSRVELNIADCDNDVPTDELLEAFRKNDKDLRVVELYYQFGRYLLISSSRKGTLPSSLQGVWNVHDRSPWGCGYWHNINVQMNYWPAFSTNLAETFEAFSDFVKAYLPRAQEIASEYVNMYLPENYMEGKGECGWAIGTSSNAYSISPPENHSGPGTGGLTSKLFWDYYDFTRDKNILNNVTYPIVQGMSKFLTKAVKNYDGRYLATRSASPEQIIGKYWNSRLDLNQMYYLTVGCAFDQQLIYENGKDFIECADLLDVKDKAYEIQIEQINRYDPIHIGYSGQIKEYEEEHFYGEIGEANHRHISHLMALMPGSLINSNTTAWMDAAKKTLLLRGDKSTGWALAHRLCAWARTGDGEHTYHLLKNLLKERTYGNLWDWHPPFQIDGNFGAIAGITEMLMQSHEGFVNLLPALPTDFRSGSFKGLKARGNFTVNCSWSNGYADTVTVESVVGGKFRLRYAGVRNVIVRDSYGKPVQAEKDDYFVSFDTQKGNTYYIENFSKIIRLNPVEKLESSKDGEVITLKWEDAYSGVYRVYKSVNDSPCYTFVCETDNAEFKDVFNINNTIQNYSITVYDGKDLLTESQSTAITVHNASELEKDRYAYLFKQNNL